MYAAFMRISILSFRKAADDSSESAAQGRASEGQGAKMAQINGFQPVCSRMRYRRR